MDVIVFFLRKQRLSFQFKDGAVLILGQIIQIDCLVLQDKLGCRYLKGVNPLALSIDWKPLGSALSHDGFCPVLARIKAYLVVQEKQVLVSKESRDFSITLAFRFASTLLELDVQLPCFVTAEVPIYVHFFIPKTKEFVLVKFN